MSYLKNIYRILFAFTFAVFFISCSSSLSDALFKPVTEIPPDKSVVYLFRPDDNKSTEFTIMYKNQEICILENGGYFPFYVEEGKVEISSKANFKMFVTGLLQTIDSTDLVFKAEMGKYYYVMCQDDEFNGNKLLMKLVPENFGFNSIKQCRLLETISN